MSAQPVPIAETKSRLVLTQGGKGGTGKTSLVAALVNWYDEYGHAYTLMDLDTEASKSRGSLIHYFPKATKLDISQPEGMDHLLNALEDGPPVVLADMGAVQDKRPMPGLMPCMRAPGSGVSPLRPLDS